VTSELIEEAARLGVENLKNKKAPKAFKLSKPIKMTLEFEQSDMADKAALMPSTKRTIERRVEYTADDIVTIYQAFRTMLALAR
jgi:D-aminopeptidase